MKRIAFVDCIIRSKICARSFQACGLSTLSLPHTVRASKLDKISADISEDGKKIYLGVYLYLIKTDQIDCLTYNSIRER